MVVKRHLLTCVFSGVLLLATPAITLAETLADAMADAYNNSGLIEQNRALLRAADEDVAIAVSRLRPVINWAADVTRTYGSATSTSTAVVRRGDSTTTDITLGLSAQLLLHDSGRSKMGVEIAKESVLGTRQALVSVEQRVLLGAVQAYMDVRSASETVALRQNNVHVIGQELRAANDRFEVGEVTRTDVALTQARLAGAQSALASAQGDYNIAIEAFRAAVGRKPGRLSPPPSVKQLAKSVDAAKGVALQRHPDILRTRHEVNAAELNVAIAKAAKQPTVNLTGRYGLTEDFNKPDSSVGGSIGIEMSGPIYQGGRLSALERQSMARRDASRANLHLVSQSVAQNVGNAFARVEIARAARAASEQQIRAARVAFRGVREEATLGARTTLDVLNAEQELLDAQANSINATSGEYVASYALLASMGLLTADALNLKVQQYDPAAYYNMVKSAPTKMSKQGKQLDNVLKSLGKQ